jgi:polyisoprenoid-binding protein YceI
MRLRAAASRWEKSRACGEFPVPAAVRLGCLHRYFPWISLRGRAAHGLPSPRVAALIVIGPTTEDSYMRSFTVILACASALFGTAAPRASERSVAATPLTVVAARVSLDGTSNIHAYTASTKNVRVAAIDVAGAPEGDLLDYVLKPGALKGFDVIVAAASLSSPKDGLDKNMHKALKVAQHAEITFRLRSLVGEGANYKAVGVLTIAGVDKEATLNLQVRRKDATLAITGTTELLMTDFGIQPPKAMMGMLKTDPQVRIRIELELGAATS